MFEGTATVAVSNAQRVLRFGRTLGFEPEREPELARYAHVQRVTRDDVHARMPARDMYALWAQLARKLAMPELPVQLARGARVEELGLLGLCVATAPTFLDALHTFARFDGLLNQSRRIRVIVEGATLEVRLESAFAPALGVRLSNETCLAQMVSAARQLCAEPIEPELVAFRHRRPTQLSAHRAHFACPLRFEQPSDRLVLRRELCTATPPSGNAAVWSHLCEEAEAELRQLALPSHCERVTSQLDSRLTLGVTLESLHMAGIARSLGTSERSLRRALAQEGTSFRELGDDLRKQRARSALARTMPLADAATYAGFADTSAFTHACRRWFGKSPGALKRA